MLNVLYQVQPGMYPGGFAPSQPQQPADPFGPIPGAQVSSLSHTLGGIYTYLCISKQFEL